MPRAPHVEAALALIGDDACFVDRSRHPAGDGQDSGGYLDQSVLVFTVSTSKILGSELVAILQEDNLLINTAWTEDLGSMEGRS